MPGGCTVLPGELCRAGGQAVAPRPVSRQAQRAGSSCWTRPHHAAGAGSLASGERVLPPAVGGAGLRAGRPGAGGRRRRWAGRAPALAASADFPRHLQGKEVHGRSPGRAAAPPLVLPGVPELSQQSRSLAWLGRCLTAFFRSLLKRLPPRPQRRPWPQGSRGPAEFPKQEQPGLDYLPSAAAGRDGACGGYPGVPSPPHSLPARSLAGDPPPLRKHGSGRSAPRGLGTSALPVPPGRERRAQTSLALLERSCGLMTLVQGALA